MQSSRKASGEADPGRASQRYTLRAEVARGGMAIVYRAYDKLAAREVAYKRLLPHEGARRARFTALFQREYDTLAHLSHPSIVSVHEYGLDAEGPFYTMELLDGQGLMELAPLPYRELCRVIRDVASALALLHARQLIHRDLSPNNVRVQRDGRTKLIDFGALMPFGVAPDVVGTPAFMAPEAMEGRVLDQRADLYALGALLYWGLTGKAAVRARSLDDLPLAWLDPITPPTLHVPELPPALEELVMSLLARDRLARPASAAEVMERLTSVAELAPEPDAARVATSYLAHPPLVGRKAALTRVDAALRSALTGRGVSLLLEAEQGRGRSATLDNVTVRAQLAGAIVLRGDGGSANAPFGVARSLVRSALAAYPDLLPPAAQNDPDLVQVLRPRRKVSAASAWSPVQASERQARTLALMQEALVQASRRHPLVIVVDELSRADSESAALLAALAAEAGQHALLLACSANQAAPRSDAYAQIRACSQLVELPALSLDETTALIDSIFGAAANSQRLAHWLHARSGGNPARCMDLTRLLLQRGLIRYATGTFSVPHDVSDDAAFQDDSAALLGRLADLSPLARDCATLLGLQEMPLPVELVAASLGAELPAAVHALEELAARAAVNLADEGATLVSGALRAALAATLSPERRRALHLAAARAISAGGKRESSLRLQAGMHLLKAGAEAEAVALLTARGDDAFLEGTTPFPLLEAVLEVLRKQGRRDTECLGVLVPLVRGGFFGDFQVQSRHLKRALAALAKVCGVNTMAKVRPILGEKPALVAGIVSGLIQHARTPAAMRYGKFPETVAALISMLSATTAASVSAFESEQAFEVVRQFEPLRVFGPDSAPSWSIEFCLATAELGVNRYAASRARYQRLLDRFQAPIKGMTPDVHLQFKQGILHGLAQSLVPECDPRCLALADELEQSHMFFAPHAQTVRMGYHGYRGHMDLVEQYRRRGELLALRGGISWSAVTVMTVRAAYMALHTGDVLRLMRAPDELEHLAQIAPKLLLYRDAMRAALELLRGRPDRALAGYEALFAQPDATWMMAHWTDRMVYAKALSACGRHQEARAVCEAELARVGDEVVYVQKGLIQQLALAQAALGEVATATRQLDALIARLVPYDNPLWSGTAHRERAKVALFARDQAGFEQHARAMSELFQSTKNPTLIQQSEMLYASAQIHVRGEARARALDDGALAFETHQSRIATSADMDKFETELLDQAPANNQTKLAHEK